MKSTDLTVRISIFSESETGPLQWEETHSATTNEEGYKLIDYSKLTVVLIEAMKEQQKMIKELQTENKELAQLKKEIEELKMSLGLLSRKE